MSGPLHLVVGPPEHGIVRHALAIAGAAGHAVRRAAAPADVDPGTLTADVVHLPFADGLLAGHCDDAAAAVERLADALDAAGRALSVTLHDVPVGDDARALRRRAAYARVVARARGVVVNSDTELDGADEWTAGTHAVHRIALPIDPVPAAAPPDTVLREAVVLGFVWAGRGHDEVLDALPDGWGLTVLGGTSDGHDDAARALAGTAAARGRRFAQTGWVPDAELAPRLAAAGVPVAPNRHATASASIATWLAHGRRPLVPATPYTRELAARLPGALLLYDTPDELAALLRAAAADPATTRLAPGCALGPSTAEAAAAYARHLAACVPPRAGARPVPGNRWDLLPAHTGELPPVSVVVPYYGADAAARRDLDRVLAGLAGQTVRELEIVVADDGSPHPPDVSAAGSVPVRTVRQPHRGFGAGRARTLGAAAARHDLLAFLDADTVPEPGYLAALLRLPATDPDALVVGRRRHADLSGIAAADVPRWFAGGSAAPAEQPEPAWLRDEYRRTGNLLHADARSYRYVISAVLGMHRELFTRLGGFDPRFDAYGGEDWELAHRAWRAGALVAHVPEAVAWHHGVDWAGREVDHRAVKDAETAALAVLLPDPVARGGGQWLPYPHTVVTMPAGDPTDVPGVLATARSAFAAGADCGVWLLGPDAAAVAARLGDARIRAGSPPADVLARCAVQVHLPGPRDLRDLDRLARRAERSGLVRSGGAVARSTRAAARARHLPPGERDAAVERLFGGQDSTAVRPLPDAPLHRLLAGLSRP